MLWESDWQSASGFVGLIIVLLVMPSLAAAVGLLLRQRWAYWLAIALNATWGALWLGVFAGCTIAHNPPSAGWYSNAGMIALSALAVVEGVYLLRKLGAAWRSLLAYLPLAVVSGWLGTTFGLMIGAD